jgi:hypothetical protein
MFGMMRDGMLRGKQGERPSHPDRRATSRPASCPTAAEEDAGGVELPCHYGLE